MPFSLYWYLLWWCKSNSDSAGIKAVIPDHFSSYCILHGHALKFKEEMLTSLTDILGEIVSVINFIKSVSRKNICAIVWVTSWTSHFFFLHGTAFFKLWIFIHGYLAFIQKLMKSACLFKGNNCQNLLQWWSWSFQVILIFGKTYVCKCELDIMLIL